MGSTPPAASADELRQAIRLVRQAAHVAADAFHADTREVRHKPDGSELTPTDLAVEDLLREDLHQHHPHDSIIGEERPTHAGTSGRRWIIDPISGTSDFVHRIPLYSVDLALEDQHGPALAISALPASRLITAAGRGLGCWVLTGDEEPPGPREAAVSNRTDLATAVVCAHGLTAWPTELVRSIHRHCRLRDGVHSMTRLLTGRADAILATGATMSYEDLACLPLLVEQAGGRVTDTTGRPVLDGDGTVLATNGPLHDEFLALLAETR